MKAINYIYIIALIFMLVTSSCIVTKKYNKPELDNHYIFRLDTLSDKGEQIGSLNWREFFNDDQLKEYIDTALVYNHDNRVAYKNIEIFNAQFKQAKAGYSPSISIDGNVQKSELPNLPANEDFTRFTLESKLSWEADLWGKITSQKLAAKAEFSKSITAQKLLQTQLIANVAITYYQLLEADKTKEVLLKTIQVRKQSVLTMIDLKEAGQGNSISVSQAKSQLHQAEILLTSVNNRIFNLENSLMILVGRPIDNLMRKALNDQIILKPFYIEKPLEILNNRPDVKEAELMFLASFENYNVAKASMYPTITLSASLGTQADNISNLFSTSRLFNSLIGGVAAPVINGKQLRVRKEVGKLQMEQSLLYFQKRVLHASIEVSNVLQEFETYSNNLLILEEQEKLLANSFNESKILLKSGLVNYLDVLNAQANLLNTQLEHIQTKSLLLQNTTTLYKALGGGVE